MSNYQNWTEKELEEYEEHWRSKGYLMIMWPESQRIMEHPLCFFESACDVYGSSAYWCPVEVWEEYKNSYYEEEEE